MLWRTDMSKNLNNIEDIYPHGSANITALLKRGHQELEDRVWEEATGFFNQALNMDAENAEAFWGLFLAGEQCINDVEYIEKACSKEGQTETLFLPEATERIEDAIKKFAIKEWLTEEEIRDMFQYDLSYPSQVKDQKTICASEKSALESNRYLARSFRYADGETAERLSTFKVTLFNRLDDQVKKTESKEKEAREAKENDYKAFLASAERKANAKHQEVELDRNQIYQEALRQLSAAQSFDDFKKAEQLFAKLAPYEDSEKMAARCRDERIRINRETLEAPTLQRAEREAAVIKQKARRRMACIFAALGVIAIGAGVLAFKIIIQNENYKAAESLLKNGQYEEAINAFIEMDGYKDSNARIEEAKEEIQARNYIAAEKLLKDGQYEDAIAAFLEMDGYKDSNARIEEAKEGIQAKEYKVAKELLEGHQYTEAMEAFKRLGDYEDSTHWLTIAKEMALRSQLSRRSIISAGGSHTIAVTVDGSVLSAGNNNYKQADVNEWTDIISVSAGNAHTVGLTSDGAVIAIGSNRDGQCETNNWSKMVDIATGSSHTVGLKRNGMVFAVGLNKSGQCDVLNWKDIIDISAGQSHTVGLKNNGTVVAVGLNGSNQCGVDDWVNIDAIAAGTQHTVGLKKDGTVVATGSNAYGQCNVTDWTDIIAIAAGGQHTVGLRTDGRVVATGYNFSGQCDVSEWTEVIAIAAGERTTVGLKADGSMLAVGNNDDGQCDVSKWENIKIPDDTELEMYLENKDTLEDDSIETVLSEEEKLQLQEADSLFDSGKYYNALQIYSQLDMLYAREKADSCNYNLGLVDMSIGQWESALKHFNAINDQPTYHVKELMDTCRDQIKKENSSDYEFLYILESVITTRLSYGKNAESKELAKVEYDYLKKYKNEPFFDSKLRGCALQYISGLEEQVDSINQKDYKYEQQIEWLHGQLTRYRALELLHNEYSFLSNNSSFKKQYIQGVDELSKQYKVYFDLRNDFLRTLDQQDFVWPSGEYKGHQILPNNTDYTLDIKFMYKIYSYGGEHYIMTKTYDARNIPPHSDFIIYLSTYDLDEAFSFYTDWEITNVK